MLKVNDIVLVKEDKPRIKWRKGKVTKLLYGNDNLVRGVELLITQKSKGKLLKIRRPLQMIVPLEICNDFNDNNDKNDNDDRENDNVSSDNLNPRDDLDDLLDKTDLNENRKSKRIAAINADIIRRVSNID